MADETLLARDKLVVAIDGPSGVGKSTVSELLSEALGIPRLDTGAMYRAAGLKILESEVDANDRGAVLETLASASVKVRLTDQGTPEVLLDDEVVGDRIRTPQVSDVTSKISAFSEVRRHMVNLQRRFAESEGAVVEGRDIGTVVFPDTHLKFFLTARPEIRAERRYEELSRSGLSIDPAKVSEDMAQRDARDSGRQDSPLSDDGTYIRIDTSDLSISEVVERMVAEIRRRSESLTAD